MITVEETTYQSYTQKPVYFEHAEPGKRKPLTHFPVFRVCEGIVHIVPTLRGIDVGVKVAQECIPAPEVLRCVRESVD